VTLRLDQLQHLTAVVEHGSVRAAARRLGLPQPALSRSIGALERELGTPLFTRAAQGMTLTVQGQRFHQRAMAVVNELRRARDELAQSAGDERGEVTVALSIMPHVGMLPRALPAFRRRWPNVRLLLIEGLFPDVEERLRTGQIDFYIGASPQAMVTRQALSTSKPAFAPGLVMRRLFGNVRTVVCRQGHPLQRVRSLKALASAEWATTAIDYNAEQDLAQLFAKHGLAAPRVMVHTRTALSLMTALTSTDLLAMVPVQWQDYAATRGTLQPIRVRERLPAPDVVLVTRQGLPMTPAAEHLCDLLLREVPR
jgi:LysR family transcriptional regulator, regulator of abg operon